MSRTIPCAILCGLFLSGSSPLAAEPLRKGGNVPFELLPSRHMLVRVTVNGKGPYSLIFDTGAPINLVSSKVAKAAGLKQSGFSLFATPKPVEVRELAVGDVSAEKVPVLVMDHPTVAIISEAFSEDYGPIEGIIGFPFFSRFATTIDYQAKQMTLKPNGFKPGDYLTDLIGRISDLGAQSRKPRIVAPGGLWGMTVEKSLDDHTAGVKITTVVPGGPAAAAGLQPADRILTIDGRWADSVSDTYSATSLVQPGRTVDVVIERAGKTMTVKLTPKKGL